MTFNSLDRYFKSSVKGTFENNEIIGWPYDYKIISDKFGSCFIIENSEVNHHLKIFTNIGNSNNEFDSVGGFMSDNFIEFDKRIYRFAKPTLYILDNTRNWQVIIDTLKGLNYINTFGYLGNDYFFIKYDSLFHYEKLNNKLQAIAKEFNDVKAFFKTKNGLDSNLVFISLNKKLLFNYFSNTTKSWKQDTSFYWYWDSFITNITANNNEIYGMAVTDYGPEYPNKLMKYSPGIQPEEVFTLPGCFNHFAIDNDLVYITTNGYINVYDIKGNFIRTIIDGNENNNCNSLKALDRDNILYSNQGIFHFNLYNREIKCINSVCKASFILKFLSFADRLYMIPGFLYSEDKGSTWKVNDYNLGGESEIFTGEDDNLYKITTSPFSLSKSIDMGKNWYKIDYDFGTDNSNNKENCFIYHEDFGILFQCSTGFYKSSDGTSWTKIAPTLNKYDESIGDSRLYYSNGIIYSALLILKEYDYYKNKYNSQITMFYRSKDCGNTWEQLMAGIENNKIKQNCSDGNGNLFAADSASIFIHKSNTVNWVSIVHNFEGGKINQMDASSDGSLFVYSAPNSIYRFTMQPDSKEEPVNTSPEITITPNPASDNIKITFNNENATGVKISFYNLLGNKVGELIETEGCKSLSWDCSGIPSGIYMVRLQTGNHLEFKCFIIRR